MTEREKEILRYIQKNPLISQDELANRLGIARSSVAVHISHLMQKGVILGKGYYTRKSPYIAVAGGANVDIGGQSRCGLIAGDSNPGKVRLSYGGVGKNIAENLAHLDVAVTFFTAFGKDMYGEVILRNCQDSGINMRYALSSSHHRTSAYLYINDEQGDMKLAVSDMEVCEELDVAYFQKHLSEINNAQLLVVDGNLPEESLRFLVSHVDTPVFADPVSVIKAHKFQEILSGIHTLKPNRLEAEILSGVKITNRRTLRQAAKNLLAKGVGHVCISLGSAGVYYAGKQCHGLLENPVIKTVNTTGAGDAFMAGLAWAYGEGLAFREGVRYAHKAAMITCACSDTVNPQLNREWLMKEE